MGVTGGMSLPGLGARRDVETDGAVRGYVTVRRRSARWASAVAVAGAAVMACSGLAVAGSAHISGVTLPSRVGAARTGPAASTAAAARATLGVDPSLRRRKGPVTVMVELDQLPAATAYARAKHKGHADAVR